MSSPSEDTSNEPNASFLPPDQSSPPPPDTEPAPIGPPPPPPNDSPGDGNNQSNEPNASFLPPDQSSPSPPDTEPAPIGPPPPPPNDSPDDGNNQSNEPNASFPSPDQSSPPPPDTEPAPIGPPPPPPNDSPDDGNNQSNEPNASFLPPNQSLPPPPDTEPAPFGPPPPPANTDAPVQPCPVVSNMTHEEKMEEAIKRANLPQGILDALPSIPALVASITVAGAVLAAAAATGIGGLVEGVTAALLLLGAALAGVQIGEGLTDLLDFYEMTRCDRAATPEDLDRAGKKFADGIGALGVGTLMLVLSLLGARGRGPTGKILPEEPPPSPPEPTPPEEPPTPQEAPPEEPPAPRKPEISRQKQDGHVKGTPQNSNRGKVGKPTSTFDGSSDEADALTQEAWKRVRQCQDAPVCEIGTLAVP